MGHIVQFQLPLPLTLPPSAGAFRLRLKRARTASEMRTIAEEILRDYDDELKRRDARLIAATIRLEETGIALTEIAQTLHR